VRLLLDTNVILWVLTDDPRLSEFARKLLQAPAKDVYFSVASLWEIGNKSAWDGFLFRPKSSETA